MDNDQRRNDEYPLHEAQERFEAAIRGSRVAGHREMKDIPRKPRARPKKGVAAGGGQKSRQSGSGAA